MDLPAALDHALTGLKGFSASRERAGRVWVAQDILLHPPPLRITAEELNYRLERAGFEVRAAANAVVAGGAAPCLEVIGCPGQAAGAQVEQLLVVPRSLLSKLRQLKFRIDRIDLSDASYENVIAFSQLVEQSLFLVRRGAAENRRKMAVARKAAWRQP